MSSSSDVYSRERSQRRVANISRQVVGSSKNDSLDIETVNTGNTKEIYQRDLLQCKEELRRFTEENLCGPILLRLAWHDAGTYDKRVSEWPQCGGANGSIALSDEIKHEANAGLAKGVFYLKRFREKYPNISWADLIQLAGATAIEACGGPVIPMRYGRMDSAISASDGNLPSAMPPFGDGSVNAADHIRNVFYRMGLEDQDIVALSGAHTIGRAFKQRSGVVEFGYVCISSEPV
mmetsp:Transcript_1024/g.2442  ORF Transcript_1024/g.2442 Transcript_1024/m.2442 type:complete len:235 (+) Transcript_1024:130-834(+)